MSKRRCWMWLCVFSMLLFPIFTLTSCLALETDLGSYIVVFHENHSSDFLEKYGGRVRETFSIISAIAVDLPEYVIPLLKKESMISYVEKEQVYHTLGEIEIGEINDEMPWGVLKINSPEAWVYSEGIDVKVAVLDTGISYDHEDLAGNVKGGINLAGRRYGSTDPRYWSDDVGHGTHVAGTIASEANGLGVIGVAYEASLYSVRVLDRGSGTTSQLMAGIEWCVTNDMHIASMSLGGGHSAALERTCQEAYDKGLLLIAAAGNSGPEDDTVEYPAGYSSVIAVSATNRNNEIASFSSRGQEVELAAPGDDIKSTLPGNRYGIYSGTSMACPHVSAVAALIWSYNNSLKHSDIRERLRATSTDLGPEGKDSNFGHGLVDAHRAVSISTPPSLPPEPPIPPTPAKNLVVDVETDESVYARIDQGVITINVTDLEMNPIVSATVEVVILRYDGEVTFLSSGTTDDQGVVQFEFRISNFRSRRSIPYLPGGYTVKAEATKIGYDSGNGQTSFEVSSSRSRIIRRCIRENHEHEFSSQKRQYIDLLFYTPISLNAKHPNEKTYKANTDQCRKGKINGS